MRKRGGRKDGCEGFGGKWEMGVEEKVEGGNMVRGVRMEEKERRGGGKG